MKTKETTIVELDKIDPLTLPELASFKEKSLTVVKENPYVEIIDNPTYELAKKARTNLRSNRTALQNQEKAIKDKLNGFKKKVENVTAELIAITEPHEIKQQTEVTRYEDIKEQERQEKARIEQERIDGIKAKIKSFADLFNTKIENLTFTGIEEFKTEFDEFVTIQPKDVFQEFEVLYDDMLSRITYSFSQKKAVLIAEENNRLEQIRLTEERAENERKQGIRNLIQEWNNNWSAIIDTLAFFKREETFADFKNEKALDCQEFQSEYAEIRNSLVQKFESKIALLQQIEDNRIASEKLAKEKADFEAKQAEDKKESEFSLKVSKRINELTSNGLNFDFQSTYTDGNFFVDILDVKTYSEEKWQKLINDIVRVSKEKANQTPGKLVQYPLTPDEVFSAQENTELFNIASVDKQIQENSWTEQGRLIEKDGVLFDTHLNKVYEPDNVQIIKDVVSVSGSPLVNYHEEDVDVKGIIVNDEEVVFESIKFESLDEDTWESIYREWDEKNHPNKDQSGVFFIWLSTNYNVPLKK